MKKISIIILYFNAEQHLEETLLSIQAQSHQNVEVIVVNDGSTAESTQLLTKILDKFSPSFPIQVLTNEKNLGVALSRNKALSAITGDYFLFLDADDVLCGKYSLEFRYQFLEESPQFDITAGYSIKIDSNSRLMTDQTPFSKSFIEASEHPDQLLKKYCEYSLQNSKSFIRTIFMYSGGCLVKTVVAQKMTFDVHFEKEEDVEWVLRFLQSGHQIKLHKLPFHFRRVHDKQYHLNTPLPVAQEILKMMKAITN